MTYHVPGLVSLVNRDGIRVVIGRNVLDTWEAMFTDGTIGDILNDFVGREQHRLAQRGRELAPHSVLFFVEGMYPGDLGFVET